VREEICGALGVGGDFVIGATKEEAEKNFATLSGLSLSSVFMQSVLPASLRPNGVEVLWKNLLSTYWHVKKLLLVINISNVCFFKFKMNELFKKDLILNIF